MKITIDTDVLRKYELSLGQFLILLLAYKGQSYLKNYQMLREKGLIEPNLFEKLSIVLSDNTKDLIAKILTESNPKIADSGIDFKYVALAMISCYPEGNKPGTTYPWCDSVEIITQKLMALVVTYNFTFTWEEAVNATEEYVHSFKDTTKMQLLKNFILKTNIKNGPKEPESMFMTIIENNREK